MGSGQEGHCAATTPHKHAPRCDGCEHVPHRTGPRQKALIHTRSPMSISPIPLLTGAPRLPLPARAMVFTATRLSHAASHARSASQPPTARSAQLRRANPSHSTTHTHTHTHPRAHTHTQLRILEYATAEQFKEQSNTHNAAIKVHAHTQSCDSTIACTCETTLQAASPRHFEHDCKG